MLSRRQFHARLLGAIALSLAPRLGAAATTTPATTPASTLATADLWLNRLTFGTTAEARAQFEALGAGAWLDDQLARPASDPDIADRLARARLHIVYDAGSDDAGHRWDKRDEMRPLDSLTASSTDLYHCIDWEQGMDFGERVRPAQEVIAASLIRAVHAPAQLREVMTQFWHDHFSVNATKDEFTAAFFPAHDAALREGAFGNFRALLGQVARSSAMLYYLNNADSRASPANENYARELLELHTLGAGNYVNDRYSSWHEVPGAADGLSLAYMDLDVYEVARAFTGWSVGDGRTIDDGVTAPKTGEFNYVDSWHDPYQKRVLGVEFAPNRAPMADGEQVLDILASHPGTARFVCTKLARRLLTDTPGEDLVQALTGVFLGASAAPDQIAQVIRALVAHPDFAATPPSKLRRPMEYLAALYRATGAQVTGTENAQQYMLMRAGWRQHEYPVPTGHPDVKEAWTGASSLNRLVDYALYAHEDQYGVVTLDLASADAGETALAFLSRWTGRFQASAEGLAQIMGVDPNQSILDFDDAARHNFAAGAIAWAALTPDTLLR